MTSTTTSTTITTAAAAAAAKEEASTTIMSSPMQIIEPSQDPEHRAVIILLESLDNFLGWKMTREKLRKFISKGGDDKGVRLIQGGRWELFLQARFKATDAFDWVAFEMLRRIKAVSNHYNSPTEIKDAILTYAKTQAARDTRLAGLNFLFDNFSLIINYTKVNAQFRHIDLQYPNYQFGLVVTNNSPGTLVYQPEHKIRTVADLQQYAWKNMPDTLRTAMEQDPTVLALLAEFGDVLCPNIIEQQVQQQQQQQQQQGLLLKTGTLCSLPGTVIHAGPRCDTYRAILFFSGSPGSENNNTAAVDGYNPDVQYFAPLLCCDLVSTGELWHHINVADRSYLLERLAECMDESQYKQLHMHLRQDSFIEAFIRDMGQNKFGTGRERSRHIVEFAKTERTTTTTSSKSSHHSRRSTTKPPKTTTHAPVVEAAAAALGKSVELVSVPELVAEYGEDCQSFPVRIYRYSSSSSDDNKDDESECYVCLHYPQDNSWEGKDKHYTLTMNNSKKRPRVSTRKQQQQRQPLFDGSNGILKDDEGNEIVCYTRRR